MKKDYSKTNEVVRTEIFNSLRKYLNDELDIEEFKQLCINVSELNPYLNKELVPVNIVKNDEDPLFKKNRNTYAYYSPYADQIYVNDFFLAKRLYHVNSGDPIDNIKPRKRSCAIDFDIMLMMLGHEMKHYFQCKALNADNPNENNKYNAYLKKISNSFFSLNFEPLSDETKINYTIEFFKKFTDDDYFKNQKDSFVDRLQYASYLKRFHETDARISSFDYAKGMIKTLLNDPLIEDYPDVKEMLKVSKKTFKYQEEKYGKDDYFQHLPIAEEFSARIMDDLLDNKVALEDLQKMGTEQAQSIASMICLNSDTDKIQKVMFYSNKNCNLLASQLHNYTSKIFPEKVFTMTPKNDIKNADTSNESNDTSEAVVEM